MGIHCNQYFKGLSGVELAGKKILAVLYAQLWNQCEFHSIVLMSFHPLVRQVQFTPLSKIWQSFQIHNFNSNALLGSYIASFPGHPSSIACGVTNWGPILLHRIFFLSILFLTAYISSVDQC